MSASTVKKFLFFLNKFNELISQTNLSSDKDILSQKWNIYAKIIIFTDIN